MDLNNKNYDNQHQEEVYLRLLDVVNEFIRVDKQRDTLDEGSGNA